jgi:multimeric flavodoxin WrbA
MEENNTVLAIVGSYRKGGMVDQAIDEILSSAGESGSVTKKIYLTDLNIDFCRNCRACTQEPGVRRGSCVIDDDMGGLLDEIENANALVFGSSMNFGTVTAVTKVFIERVTPYAWWPWGTASPKTRNTRKTRRAVVVASSAAPSLLARFSTRMVKLMKDVAGLLGARTVGTLFIGLAAVKENQETTSRTRRKARSLGKKLVNN